MSRTILDAGKMPALDCGLTAAERKLLNAVANSLLVTIVGLSLLLVARRLSGALVQPLAGSAIVAAAAVSGLIAMGLRLGHNGGAARFALPGAASILLVAALTLPATPIWGIVAAWFLLIGSEAASWLVLYERGRGAWRGNVASGMALAQEDVVPEEGEVEIPIGLVQQVTRVRERGRESIHALVQAEIAAGDRMAVVHLAFCPPLETTPELTAHAVEAEDAEVRITQAETFGARMEVKLARAPASKSHVLIEVLGHSNDRPPG